MEFEMKGDQKQELSELIFLYLKKTTTTTLI